MPERGCPQSGNQHQDLLKHLPWHRHLGQLERHVTALADDLGANVDQLLA
jgi:hypothetical protein